MIEDEEEEYEAPEDQTEDVINLDSDEDEEELVPVVKQKEKQVVATKVLFSSFGKRDEVDDQIEEVEAERKAEVVGISDEEDNNVAGVAPSQESLLVEDEESPKLSPA